MAGSSMVFTYADTPDGAGIFGNVRKIIGTWVSDSAAGTASGSTRLTIGRILKVQTVPGTAGLQPSDNYTVTITDGNGINILTACDKTLSANQSHTAAQETYTMLLDHESTPTTQSLHPAVCDILTVAISGAGNSKAGAVHIFYRPL